MQLGRPLAVAMLAVATFGVGRYVAPGAHVAPKAHGRTVDVAAAEADAWRVFVRTDAWCAARGQYAEGWAEVNSAMPKGYEVIADCLGARP